MARQQSLQPSHAPAEQPLRHADLAGRYLDGGYMDTTTAARFVGCPSERAFLAWAKREQIQLRRRGRHGRRLVVLVEALRAAMRPVEE